MHFLVRHLASEFGAMLIPDQRQVASWAEAGVMRAADVVDSGRFTPQAPPHVVESCPPVDPF